MHLTAVNINFMILNVDTLRVRPSVNAALRRNVYDDAILQ